MDIEESNRKLEKAVQKRDEIARQKERLLGRLEEARKRRAALEEQCREKNVDPDKLSETIDRLTKKYKSTVDEICEKVQAAEEELRPFLEKLNL